jgi:hypothetical protein
MSRSAPRRKQFFGDKDGEGRADRAANDPDSLAAELKGIQLGMVAGPLRKPGCCSRLAQPSDQVSIRIENADCWHCEVREALLPPRFAQQRGRREHRSRGWALVGE